MKINSIPLITFEQSISSTSETVQFLIPLLLFLPFHIFSHVQLLKMVTWFNPNNFLIKLPHPLPTGSIHLFVHIEPYQLVSVIFLLIKYSNWHHLSSCRRQAMSMSPPHRPSMFKTSAKIQEALFCCWSH